MNIVKTIVCTSAIIISIGSNVSAIAEDSPESTIEYRQNLMYLIKGSAGALGPILKGEVSYKDEAIPLAKTLAMASRQSVNAFKQDTTSFKDEDELSSASPDIWEKWDDYAGRWNKLASAADALAKALETGDKKAIKKAGKVIGSSCKGCHEDYTVD